MPDLKYSPCWLVKIFLPYCANTFGVSPCTATGQICYYTYFTCTDKTHFSPTTREVRLCTPNWIYAGVEGYLPLVGEVNNNSAELNYNDNRLEFADLDLICADDAPLPKANPDKSVSRLENAGTYLRNLFTRHNNWHKAEIEVYFGDATDPIEKFERIFVGVLEEIEYQSDYAVRISAKDIFGKENAKSHKKTDDKCTLKADYSGGQVLELYHGHKFEEAGIVLADGKYIKYKGRSDEGDHWHLLNCAYCFGSSGTITAGTKVQLVLVYERDGGHSVGNDNNKGFPVDWCIVDLLARSKINLLTRLEWREMDATLDGDITADATTLVLSSATGFPDQGIIRIEDEIIIYTAKSGNNLYWPDNPSAGQDAPLFHKRFRGAWGSEKKSHSSGAKIYIPQITFKANQALTSWELKRKLWEQKEILDLINEIQACTMAYVVQNSAHNIELKPLAQPAPGDSVGEFTDDLAIMSDPAPELINDQEERDTAVVCFYKPVAGEDGDDPGETPKNYLHQYVYDDGSLNNDNYFPERKEKIIFAPWLWRETEVSAMVQRWHARFSLGTEKLRINVPAFAAEGWIGDFVRVTSAYLQGVTGAPLNRRLCQIISRADKGDSVEMVVADVRLTKRYMYWAKEHPTLAQNLSETGEGEEVLVPLINQPNYNSAIYFGSGAMRDCETIGQTFTLTENTHLGRITVNIEPYNNLATIWLKLYDANMNLLATVQSNSQYTGEFDLDIELNPGTYRMEIYLTGFPYPPSDEDVYLANYSNENPYTGGVMYRDNSPQNSDDLAFSIEKLELQVNVLVQLNANTYQDSDLNASGVIQIENELIKYAGKSLNGSVLTLTGCTRGWNGTTPASHTAGRIVAFLYCSFTGACQNAHGSWCNDKEGLHSAGLIGANGWLDGDQDMAYYWQ